jgi:hypothetical protein
MCVPLWLLKAKPPLRVFAKAFALGSELQHKHLLKISN